MRKAHTLTAALLLLLCTRTAFPQSLGELARKEEERRKTIKAPSKVYTNDDLKGGAGGSVGAPAPGPAPASGPAAAAPPADGSAASPPPTATPGTEATPPTQVKDQKYWKTRITDARNQLDRSKTLQDAFRSRVNALNTDFVNKDDPAQRAVIERDRQKALSEMARLDKEIQDQTKAIAAIEEEARRANVPPGWLR